jgi:hypothetical protein
MSILRRLWILVRDLGEVEIMRYQAIARLLAKGGKR